MDRRTVLAFILIGILTFLWMWSWAWLQKRHAGEAEQVAEIQQPVPASETPTAAAEPSAAPAAVTVDVPLQDEIRIKSDSFKYELVWTNRGGALRQARLTGFPENLKSERGVILLDSSDACAPTLALVDPKGILPLDSTNYEVIEASDSRIAFQATFPNGLQVLKEFFPRPNSYDMGVKVTFQNAGIQGIETPFDLVAAGRITPEGGIDADVKGIVAWRYPETERIGVERLTPKKVRKQSFVLHDSTEKPLAWAGSVNRYFATVLQFKAGESGPVTSVDAAEIAYLPNADVAIGTTGRPHALDNVQVRVRLEKRSLAPGEQASYEFSYFMGPTSDAILANHPDLAKLLDYGTFGFISKLLLSLLHAFYRLIPNYGVGIILMTLVVRICLFPFSRKSQIAMTRMQKLQPLIKEMQEKYKDDKQRQSRELMELYRKHNANPMSGCFPLLFQLPVFWGLFRMLQYSVDLRQQGFLFWIDDLSRPDMVTSIAGFPIRVLPVLMVASWVIQQMTMPKPADPQQAQTQKMMMFMPIMFGFIMYGMASGLTLYWLMSTFLGILEQKLIKWQIRRKEERGEFQPVVVEAAADKSKPRRRK